MGVLDELALSGVDRVEKSLGARAALRALVPLLDTLPAGPGRARATLRAIVYAAEVDEPTEVATLCARWPHEAHARASDVWSTLLRLVANRRLEAALALADADVRRATGSYDAAAAHYAHGRVLDAVAQHAKALAAYEAASDAAHEQPRLRQRARAREVRALVCTRQTAEAARRASALLPLERGLPPERLWVAVAALHEPGRYRRAAALDVLENLARGGDVASLAIRHAAWHAERSVGALSSIELDRIEAILAHEPDPERRATALARLRTLANPEHDPVGLERAARTDPDAAAFAARARRMLDRDAPGPRPDAAREALGWTALRAIAAVRDADRAEARDRLRELAIAIDAGARVEAVAWTAALVALSDPAVVRRAAELARALLQREGEPPPRGYTDAASRLEAAGENDLATIALRRAHLRREPGARARLAAIVRDRGWTAAQQGRTDDAIALLREARALFGS